MGDAIVDEAGVCLSDDSVLAIVDGAADYPSLARDMRHLDRCQACRTLVVHATGAPLSQPIPTSLAHALSLGARFGRYIVEDLIGVGSMGLVYSAQDTELRRRVALKIMRQDLRACSSETLAFARTVPDPAFRLLKEAQAMARLSHPNAVTIYDVGTLGDDVFVAMELVEGRTLTTWLADRPRSAREVVECFLCAGRGVAAAHEAGLVHRDFKPDNVLVGNDGRVRVTDFGLACAIEDRGDAGGRLVFAGTPAYMSPEQLKGSETDSRTDQFSFCVALYEALYGERPFLGQTLETLTAEVLGGRVRPAPASVRVPAALRRVLLRGMNVDAAARFSSMQVLLSRVEEALDRGAARRGRPGVWLLAGGFLAAIVVTVGANRGAASTARVASFSAPPAPSPPPASSPAGSPHASSLAGSPLASAGARLAAPPEPNMTLGAPTATVPAAASARHPATPGSASATTPKIAAVSTKAPAAASSAAGLDPFDMWK
jgi:serine/threonine protein kinase